MEVRPMARDPFDDLHHLAETGALKLGYKFREDAEKLSRPATYQFITRTSVLDS